MQDKEKNILDPNIISWVNRKFNRTFDDDVDTVMQAMPKNNTNEIFKSDLLNWFDRRLISLKIKNPQKTVSEIRKLFTKYDIDKSSSMSREEFKVFFWWVQAYVDAV